MNEMHDPAAGEQTLPESKTRQTPLAWAVPRAFVRLPDGLRSLGHRDYRIFFLTQFLSLSGTWMQTLAQSWLVLTITDSAAALGLIGVFQFGPTLILGLPAGVLVDRFPKRAILLSTQTAFAVVTGLLAFQVQTGRVELWQIYAAALGLGIVSAVDMPARQAFVVDLVGQDDLMNGIALNSALFNTTRIVGPALAGLVLSTYGAGIAFVLNALSYIPVIIGLSLMRTRGFPRPDAGVGTPLDRLREGLAYARRTPPVFLPIILAGLMAVFGMNFNVWVPLLARDALHIGAGGFGLMLSALGIGSLTGALVLAFAGRRPAMRLLLTTALLFGLIEIVLGAATGAGAHPALAMLLMVGTGFTMTTTMTQANTTVQTNTPDHLRGRVMSIYLTVFAGATPFGDALAGVASEIWTAPIAVAMGGAIVAVVVLVLSRRLLGADRRAALNAAAG